MKNKRVVVLIKFRDGELNPFDGAALECALCSGYSDIVALTMSPPSVAEAVEDITRLGVRCIIVSDRKYAGSDTLATSYILSEAIRRLDPDMIFCGRQSVDGDTAQVPLMLAERLGFDIKQKVIDIKSGKMVLRNGESCIPTDKTVYTFEKIRTLRFPSVFSKPTETEIWDNSFLYLDEKKCGTQGSSTKVIKTYENHTGRRLCKFYSFDALHELIKTGLNKPIAEKRTAFGKKRRRAFFVGDIREVAEGVADEVFEIKSKGKTARDIAEELRAHKAEVVLWENAEDIKPLAAKVAVLTGSGLCADCVSFRTENGQFVMTRPAFGGNVTADIISESDMAFATVKSAGKDRLDVVFGVGKGAVHRLKEIEELAKKYSAEVCCSRSVADSGAMPYEKQVGLTGKTISPKVYVAFGISGAAQHVCAIAGAQTVIAVNCDRQAKIFDYADYGIVKEL